MDADDTARLDAELDPSLLSEGLDPVFVSLVTELLVKYGVATEEDVAAALPDSLKECLLRHRAAMSEAVQPAAAPTKGADPPHVEADFTGEEIPPRAPSNAARPPAKDAGLSGKRASPLSEADVPAEPTSK
jgi:hypothetical protein